MALPIPAPTNDIPQFDKLFTAEDRHFWFRSRNRVIGDLFRRLTEAERPGYRILEIGCGNGNVLRVLEEACAGAELIGSELYEKGAAPAPASRTRCRLVQSRRLRSAVPDTLPLRRHVRRSRASRGRSQGAGVCPRCAGAGRQTGADGPRPYGAVEPGRRRRRALPPLCARRVGNGVAVRRVSNRVPHAIHANADAADVAGATCVAAALPVLARAARRGQRPSAAGVRVREYQVNEALNRVLGWALQLEAALLKRKRRLPLGTSLLAVAVKDRQITDTDAC